MYDFFGFYFFFFGKPGEESTSARPTNSFCQATCVCLRVPAAGFLGRHAVPSAYEWKRPSQLGAGWVVIGQRCLLPIPCPLTGTLGALGRQVPITTDWHTVAISSNFKRVHLIFTMICIVCVHVRGRASVRGFPPFFL